MDVLRARNELRSSTYQLKLSTGEKDDNILHQVPPPSPPPKVSLLRSPHSFPIQRAVSLTYSLTIGIKILPSLSKKPFQKFSHGSTGRDFPNLRVTAAGTGPSSRQTPQVRRIGFEKMQVAGNGSVFMWARV